MTKDKWDKKLNDLRDTYPKINNIDWGKIIHEEPDVLHSIVSSVVRPKTTKKSKITVSEANQRIAKISNSDYSELPFPEALDVLAKDMTIRSLAEKTNMSTYVVFNFKTGNRSPSFSDMEHIAGCFDRDASFFLEYRIAKVLSAIDNFLVNNPEIATTWFKKVSNSSGIMIK